MTKIRSFRDLKVWEKSHGLVIRVYKMTGAYPKHELFALVNQSRRATVSVPSNIVEGFRRPTIKEGIRFYQIANASLEELRYQLFLAKDLDYCSNEEYETVRTLCEEVSKMLNAWIKKQHAFL